ncbi:MAG: PilZ domain-containing protein [Bacillota bacterium]
MTDTPYVNGKEIITLNREIWLHTPPQPALSTIVTGIEGDIFWVRLPRDGRQVLVLGENQELKVGLSLKKGFYITDTKVVILGKDNEKFYGLTIPDRFVLSQERQFIRVNYPANAIISSGELKAQTTVVNFSAGGVMVYLVPELEKIIRQNREMTIHVNINGLEVEAEIQQAWKKFYAEIPFAGFKFINITPDIQEKIIAISFELYKDHP